jgi:hypothetical protein
MASNTNTGMCCFQPDATTDPTLLCAALNTNISTGCSTADSSSSGCCSGMSTVTVKSTPLTGNVWLYAAGIGLALYLLSRKKRAR